MKLRFRFDEEETKSNRVNNTLHNSNGSGSRIIPGHKRNIFILEEDESGVSPAKIKVIGVGGGGCNAVNRMIVAGLENIDFIATNTDMQVLSLAKSPVKVQIGKKLTKGLGAGGVPEIGRQSVEENRDDVARVLQKSDMVFITAGMGGGTGTGAAPVIAELAKESKALTIAVVTKPFEFEGINRMRQAEEGIKELKDKVDTLIVVSNQKLLSTVPRHTTFEDAFKLADDVLLDATRGISDLITKPGLVNLDFADVRTIMSGMGDALMGASHASGEDRAEESAKGAISSPLLENVSIRGAKGVLINISGGPDMTLQEVNDISSIIREAIGDDANIIFGAVTDTALNDQIRVTVIAAGLTRPGEESQGVESGDGKIIYFDSQPKDALGRRRGVGRNRGIEPFVKFNLGDKLHPDLDDADVPAIIRARKGMEREQRPRVQNR